MSTLLENENKNVHTGYTSHTYAEDHGWSVDVSVSPETYKQLQKSFRTWTEIEVGLSNLLDWIAKLRLG